MQADINLVDDRNNQSHIIGSIGGGGGGGGGAGPGDGNFGSMLGMDDGNRLQPQTMTFSSDLKVNQNRFENCNSTGNEIENHGFDAFDGNDSVGDVENEAAFSDEEEGESLAKNDDLTDDDDDLPLSKVNITIFIYYKCWFIK